MRSVGATRQQDSTSALDFLGGGGEMGARMRALDWSGTALGPSKTGRRACAAR
jgi:hypothetical protein